MSMEFFFFRVLRITAILVFIVCFIGVTINLKNCFGKYIKVNKKLKIYRNNNISNEDLNSLTEKEYYLWIINFLKEYNYIDSNPNTSCDFFLQNISNTFIATKNDLPLYINIIKSPLNSNISLKNCHEFLGDMIIKKCSIGILVYKNTLPKDCKTFLNTVPTDFKITYLNNTEILEFFNEILEFPTSLA